MPGILGSFGMRRLCVLVKMHRFGLFSTRHWPRESGCPHSPRAFRRLAVEQSLASATLVERMRRPARLPFFNSKYIYIANTTVQVSTLATTPRLRPLPAATSSLLLWAFFVSTSTCRYGCVARCQSEHCRAGAL
jgi:hypothetical protein